MLIVQNFVRPLRYGPLGIFWLAALAALIGFGLGPTIAYYADVQPSALTSAVGLTALTVVGMGAAGFAWSKDLAPLGPPALDHRPRSPSCVSILGLVVRRHRRALAGDLDRSSSSPRRR